MDLEEAPKTVDEFAAQIADYCGKKQKNIGVYFQGKNDGNSDGRRILYSRNRAELQPVRTYVRDEIYTEEIDV